MHIELYIRHSNILIQTGRRETGRQLDKICLSFFLWIGTRLAFFHSSGNMPSFSQFLKMIFSGFHMETPHSFNISMLIISYPWALFESSFWYLHWRQQRNKMILKVTRCDLLRQMEVYCYLREVCTVLLIWIKEITFLFFVGYKFVIMVNWKLLF